MTAILVTGASGSVGRHVVDALLEGDFKVIAGCRSTSSMPLPQTENAAQVTVRAFDFLDQGTWDAAVDGVDHIFLMRPPAIAAVEASINPFIRFARTRGVDHFVFLSVAGAGENKVVPHRKVEDFLRSEGANHTNLRPGFFAQNVETAYGDDIRDDDRIYVPAGRKQPVNWIDTRDIADVAAKILHDPVAHRGLNYTLAGPGPVRWEEVVASLSRVLQRPIRYEAASVGGYLWHLSRRRRLPLGAVVVQTVLHFLLRFGQGATEDSTMEGLLGRPGRSVHRYIEDHATTWMTGQSRS